MEAYWWWLIVAAIAAVVEAISFSLITVWFVAGALVAFGVAFVGGPLWLQFALFAAVSVASLILIRPVAAKSRTRGKELESSVVGEQARVIEAVDAEHMTGRVETANHMTWAAVSSTGEYLEADALVNIIGQQSVKLVVERARR